jgi:hypothetical protein
MKFEEGATRADYVLVLSTGTGACSGLSKFISGLLISNQTFHPAQRQFWEGEVFKTSKCIPSLAASSPVIKTCHPDRSLCRPSLGRHHRKNCVPIHSSSHPRTTPAAFLVPRLASLRLRLAIQRSRARLRQDQELELVRARRSAQER